MADETIVMYDSFEAAEVMTKSGWVSRDGRFWGSDEHTARMAGCTHIACSTCGAVYEQNRYCKPCHDRKRAAVFAGLPVETWDGQTPLCLYDSDRYFFGEDVLDWLADHPEEVRICKCKPGYLSKIDRDVWADDLPEDGDLPDAVEEALAALNAAIAQAGPSCWWEDAIAIDVADLRSRMASRR